MQDQQFIFGSTLDNGQPATQRQLTKRKKQIKSAKVSDIENKEQITRQQPIQNIHIDRNNYLLSKARNPCVCVFTVLFKAIAFFFYFFMSYFISNVLIFIFTIILGSMDFWVIKNISGRLLVGLRWWSDYDEKGNQIWKFQTHNQNFTPNLVDQSFFWSSQIIGTLVWTFLLFVNILQLDLLQALQVGINFGFCSSNLYGFYMCRGQHHKKLKNMAKQIKTNSLLKIARTFI